MSECGGKRDSCWLDSVEYSYSKAVSASLPFHIIISQNKTGRCTRLFHFKVVIHSYVNIYIILNVQRGLSSVHLKTEMQCGGL